MLDWRVLLFGPRTAMLRRCERGLQNDEFTTRALSRRGHLLGAAAHLWEAAGMAACIAGGPTSLQTADAKSIQQRAHNAKEERCMLRATWIVQSPQPADGACGEAAFLPTPGCRTRRLQYLYPLLGRSLQQSRAFWMGVNKRGVFSALAPATSRGLDKTAIL